MTTTALNRALLARQGLLERLDVGRRGRRGRRRRCRRRTGRRPPAALWSRVEGFEPEALYAALQRANS